MSSSLAVQVLVRRPRSTRLSSFIDNAERILTIEDTAELQLAADPCGPDGKPPGQRRRQRGGHATRLSPKNALRMRPDRIIVGETRGEEVIDMLQAMNTGHDGSMTTIHANSARDGVSRLENMIAMAGIEMPIKATRSQISSAVNLIVQASRLQDGSRRMVSITEITGMEGEVISMQEVFRYQRVGLTPDNKIIGHFTATGVRSTSPNGSGCGAMTCQPIDLRTLRRGVDMEMVISAEPIIYGLIFVGVLALVEGIYLTVFRHARSASTTRINRRLEMLEKGAGREAGAGTTPQGDGPAHEVAVDPALFDPGRKGAEGEYRLFAPAQLILIMALLSVVAFVGLTVGTGAGLAGAHHRGGRHGCRRRLRLGQQ